MHICYVLNSFPNISETFISDEIYELIKKGNKATIVTLNKSNYTRIHAKAQFVIERCQIINLIKISRTNAALYFLKFFVFNPIRALRLLRKFKETDSPRWVSAQLMQLISTLPTNIDIIHAHFADTNLLYAEALAICIDKKFSFTVHGYDIRDFPIGKETLKRLGNKSSRVIAYSNSNIESLNKIGIFKEKISLIPCGVDISLLGPQAEQYEGGPLKIVCVARLHPIKCHSIILHAIKNLVTKGVQVSLVLIGHGELRCSLEKLAVELKIKDHVYFAGACEQAEVINYLRTAHLHVLASLHEGLGVANLEAMAMGLAVIGTNVGGLAEVIRNESNGLLVPPNNADYLAACIQRIYDSPKLWKKLSDNGRDFCINNYSQEILVEKLITTIST